MVLLSVSQLCLSLCPLYIGYSETPNETFLVSEKVGKSYAGYTHPEIQQKLNKYRYIWTAFCSTKADLMTSFCWMVMLKKNIIWSALCSQWLQYWSVYSDREEESPLSEHRITAGRYLHPHHLWDSGICLFLFVHPAGWTEEKKNVHICIPSFRNSAAVCVLSKEISGQEVRENLSSWGSDSSKNTAGVVLKPFAHYLFKEKRAEIWSSS